MLGLLVAGLVLALILLDQQQAQVLALVQESFDRLSSWWQAHPVWFIAGFMAAYVLINALFLPGGIIFTLLAGALLGTPEGIFLASAGYMLGVGCGFWIARTLLRDAIQHTYPDKLYAINANVMHHGWVYLIMLRLVPMLPAPLITLLMALTPMHMATFLLATFLGRLPLTIIYASAGSELAHIQSLGDILTPRLLGLLIALALIIGAGHLLKTRLLSRKRKAEG